MSKRNPLADGGGRWKVPVTAERVRELLGYNPDTGHFTWLKNVKGGKRAGDRAGSLAQHGYITIRLDGKLYYGHRLAWLVVHGIWPELEIDHANGDRGDNRLCNLRAANRRQQAGNMRTRKGISGRRGVCRDKHGKKWVAHISLNDKLTHIGTFETIEDAADAYATVAREYFGPEFAKVD